MEPLRSLPSVDHVLQQVRDSSLPRVVVRDIIRKVLDDRRQKSRANLQAPERSVEAEVRQQLARLIEPSLRPVINATGIILHTNLGRAALADFRPINGYSNLEYDLSTGKRGKRDVHVGSLLQTLLGKPAIVVNNNAAAVFLVLNELAAAHEVIVSRGELIEIGDGFRIPEIMARSGAILREVGTTNRTRTEDYEAAVNDQTRVILRVHPSNFHISGFAARPNLKELCDLGRERKLPVFEDLGSGCLVDLRPYGIREPLVQDSFTAGVHVVSFSCDKLLGGPQSGIIAGDEDLISRIRRNPLYRAFRVDKLILQALETTLRLLLCQQWNQIPTLRMIVASRDEIRARANRVANHLRELNPSVVESESPIGGGSTPDQSLPTCLIRLQVPNAAKFEQALRAGATAVIARIEKDNILLDMRTVADEEEGHLVSAVLQCAGA